MDREEVLRRKRLRTRLWNQKNKEWVSERNREYYLKHRDKIVERKRKLRKENPETGREACRRWAAKNKATVNLIAATKRASKRNATPCWLTDAQWIEMERIYSECPAGHHVDHIVPISAVDSMGERIACGLHVPWNLQYLPATENIQKKNRI